MTTTMTFTLAAHVEDGPRQDVNSLAVPVRVTTLGDASAAHIRQLEARSRRAFQAFVDVMAADGCRWCGAPIEECLPHEPGDWVHEDTGMSLCWAAPDGESAAPTLEGPETP